MNLQAPSQPDVLSPAARFAAWVDLNRRWFFIGIVCAYMAGFTGRWRIEPDAGLYLTLGRNLAEGHGYVFHEQINRLAYPGLPWLHAAIFSIFGSTSLVPNHIAILLIALLNLAAIYRLINLHADRTTAVMVTVGVAAIKSFYILSMELRNDMPFALGVTCFLIGWEAIAQSRAKRPRVMDILIGIIGLGLAVVMRPTMWAVLLAAGAAILISLFKHRVGRWISAGIIGLLAGVVAWAIVNGSLMRGVGSSVGDYESSFVNDISTRWRDVLHTTFIDRFPQMLNRALPEAVFQTRLGYVNTALGILMMVLGIALIRRRVVWGLLVLSSVIIIPLAVNPQERYFSHLLPLLVFAWWRMIVCITARLRNIVHARIVFYLLLAFGMGTNGSKVGGIIIHQHSRNFYKTYEDGKWDQCIQLGKAIERLVPPDAVVLIEHNMARSMTFLSRREVYDRRDFTSLPPVQRPVFVIDPLDEPGMDILRLRGVKIDSEPALAHVGRWEIRGTRPIAP